MERFVEIPQERQPPEDVLARLREIDPMAELIYIGKGRWWLGVVKPDSPRIEVAKRTLDFWADKGIKNAWAVERQIILKSQGFGLIATLQMRDGKDPPWGAVIEDFRQADFIYRNWGTENETVRRQIEESGVLDDEMRLRARAATLERMGGDERYLFSRLIRGNPAPVTVGANIT